MIVLDEQLQGLGLEEALSRWYRGAIFVIKQLRPGTVIKDEAIPSLLRRLKQPTFVTLNAVDFWRRVPKVDKESRAWHTVISRLLTSSARFT